MLLFGHSLIKSEKFYHIKEIEDIQKTPPNSTVILEFSKDNIDIVEYLNQNFVKFALYAENIKDVILSNALDASYIVVKDKLAKSAQNLANEYLFDAKILVFGEDENDIEKFAMQGIDGIIFPNAIVKL